MDSTQEPGESGKPRPLPGLGFVMALSPLKVSSDLPSLSLRRRLLTPGVRHDCRSTPRGSRKSEGPASSCVPGTVELWRFLRSSQFLPQESASPAVPDYVLSQPLCAAVCMDGHRSDHGVSAVRPGAASIRPRRPMHRFSPTILHSSLSIISFALRQRRARRRRRQLRTLATST